MLHQLREVAVLQILVELALAELRLAARLGDVRQVGELRQLVAQLLEHEHLPRRVREVLLGADHVRDLHVVVVDDRRQVVQARAVGPLDDMVLLAGPVDADFAADQIVEHELAFARHQQPHDALAAFGFEALGVGVGFRPPAAAVDERPAGLLRRIALGLQFFGRGESRDTRRRLRAACSTAA